MRLYRALGAMAMLASFNALSVDELQRMEQDGLDQLKDKAAKQADAKLIDAERHSRYERPWPPTAMPHQGKRERARRVRQMAKAGGA